MIVRPKLNWFRMLFVWRGSVLHAVLLPLTVILLLSMAVVWGHQRGITLGLHLNPAPFSLIGVALAIFVSFRNNASYDRYWEARKLWGELLIRARDLARQAVTLPGLPPSHPEVQAVIDLLRVFPYTLKHQLRHTDSAADLQQRLPPELVADILTREYQSVHVLRLLSLRLVAWHREGRLSDILFDSCQRHVDGLSAALGGCERIGTTAIPYAYNVLLHRTVYFYSALLPFGLVDSIGVATPVISVFIAYTFMALDALASELENPFGEEANDLPLAALSLTIERSVMETADAPSLPPPAVPDAFYRLR